MIAVELAARYVEHESKYDAEIVIHCDNQSVVGAYNRGRSRNFYVNESIRRVDVIGMALNVRFRLEFVPGSQNRADDISRGTLPPSWQRLPNLGALPEEITRFLEYA